MNTPLFTEGDIVVSIGENDLQPNGVVVKVLTWNDGRANYYSYWVMWSWGMSAIGRDNSTTNKPQAASAVYLETNYTKVGNTGKTYNYNLPEGDGHSGPG